MSEQNPMSILLTIRDNGEYEIYAPTLGAFRTENWDTALETIAEWEGRLRRWKRWTQEGKGLRAEMERIR